MIIRKSTTDVNEMWLNSLAGKMVKQVILNDIIESETSDALFINQNDVIKFICGDTSDFLDDTLKIAESTAWREEVSPQNLTFKVKDGKVFKGNSLYYGGLVPERKIELEDVIFVGKDFLSKIEQKRVEFTLADYRYLNSMMYELWHEKESFEFEKEYRRVNWRMDEFGDKIYDDSYDGSAIKYKKYNFRELPDIVINRMDEVGIIRNPEEKNRLFLAFESTGNEKNDIVINRGDILIGKYEGYVYFNNKFNELIAGGKKIITLSKGMCELEYFDGQWNSYKGDVISGSNALRWRVRMNSGSELIKMAVELK